jgi:penicillin-binding protein 1A
LRAVGKPVAGKTGTTNDARDVWFVGFTPEIAVGVYLGYDKPRQIGRTATGGHLAAPVVRDFLKMALADRPALEFKVPPGIKLIRIDPKSGFRAPPGAPGAILEAFKPGTAPPDYNTMAGTYGQDGAAVEMISPEAARSVRTGSGLW